MLSGRRLNSSALWLIQLEASSSAEVFIGQFLRSIFVLWAKAIPTRHAGGGDLVVCSLLEVISAVFQSDLDLIATSTTYVSAKSSSMTVKNRKLSCGLK